jgi:hypothetical protein
MRERNGRREEKRREGDRDRGREGDRERGGEREGERGRGREREREGERKRERERGRESVQGTVVNLIFLRNGRELPISVRRSAVAAPPAGGAGGAYFDGRVSGTYYGNGK